MMARSRRNTTGPRIEVTFGSRYSWGTPTTLSFPALDAPSVGQMVYSGDRPGYLQSTRTWDYEYPARKALQAVLNAEEEPVEVRYYFADGSSLAVSDWTRLDRERGVRGDDGRLIGAFRNRARKNSVEALPQRAWDMLERKIRRALWKADSRMAKAEVEELSQDLLGRLVKKGTVLDPRTGKRYYAFARWTSQQLDSTVSVWAKELARKRNRFRKETMTFEKEPFGIYEPEEARASARRRDWAAEQLREMERRMGPVAYKVWAASVGEPPYSRPHAVREIASMLGLTQGQVQQVKSELKQLAAEYAFELAEE